MNGVVNGVYFCNNKRLDEINERLYSRNLTNAPIKMEYSIRSVPTRYVLMPTVDQHQPSCVPCLQKPIYNTQTMFTPATSLPFNGFQENVDVETRLHNTIAPLQAAPQSKFIPDSRSDLFNNSYLVEQDKQQVMTNQGLFQQEQFAPFDPNTCNIGHKLFNNFTRYQVRSLN